MLFRIVVVGFLYLFTFFFLTAVDATARDANLHNQVNCVMRFLVIALFGR